MNERTPDEKDTFGKVKLSELKLKSKYMNSSSLFTEDKVDQLIDVYLNNMKQPNELIVKTIERSRDRFLREYAKYEAFYEQLKFYTEEGIKERN